MSTMRSNLLCETSEFRLMRIRPGVSSGGLLSHKSRSIAFGSPAGGCFPGQLAKLQLSRVAPPSAVTDVRPVLPGGSPFYWYDPEALSKIKKKCTDAPLNLGIVTVPERMAFVIERFGNYAKTLNTPGIHFLIPLVDTIAYIHSLEVKVIPIGDLSAITKDIFFIQIGGILWVEVVDPKLASYEASHPLNDVTQLAREKIRSEVREMTLDRVYAERDTLNQKIQISINEAAKDLGLQCLRFKIEGILLPHGGKLTMEEAKAAMEAATKREKFDLFILKYKSNFRH